MAYNITKALNTLGDEVRFVTMTGKDFAAEYVRNSISEIGVSTECIKPILKETPNSVVLYDETGKRQIYCDLKDIQDTVYEFEKELYEDCDIIIACNANFNRDLLRKAKATGKIIATDVHVLGDINDEYNREFMKSANILFLSDENIKGDYKEFLMELEKAFGNDIIVLGMGNKGAMMYVKAENKFYQLPAITVGKVINTVGAGDALFSSFIHFYAKGMTTVDALKYAEIFASYKIGYDGASTGFAKEDELNEFVHLF